MEISHKWLGEGAKGVLDPGSKGLPKVFCTTQTLFCTGATLFCTSARRLWHPGSKTPFAPSPNHLWEISIFGPSPRTLGSQSKNPKSSVFETVLPETVFAPFPKKGPCPVLPFLDFSVLPRENAQINQGFLSPPEPTKTFPEGPKIKKFEISSEIENFERA